MNTHSNNPIESTRLHTENGLEISLLNLGATLQSIRVPTAQGMVETLLGYPEADDYRDNPAFLGSTIGRCAGRIENGQFELNGKSYQLERNDPDHGHCLHSGSSGFHNQMWTTETDGSGQWVSYRYVSPDGEGGFPGRVEVEVRYSLVSRMSLQIDYRARSDVDSVVNLTNHAYFNLNGDGSSIENHEVWINSDLFLPIAGNMLPTGDICNVNGTLFDFRHKTLLSERLGLDKPQLQLAGGIDHFFLLNKAMKYPAIAASIASEKTGIRLKFYSSRPGVQFYTGNSLQGQFARRSGLCLEFQNAPNAPNVEGFPSAVLEANTDYHRQLVMEFECG